MRNLIIILICAGAGYWLYTNQEAWTKYVWSSGDNASATPTPTPTPTAAPGVAGIDIPDMSADAELKTPIAFRMVAREGYGPFGAAVVLVDGKKWRMEGKIVGTLQTGVVVCDGTNTVARPAAMSASRLDPRPLAKLIEWVSGRMSTAIQKMGAQSTEQMDGRTCWKIATSLGGTQVQFWIETGTGFLVCYNGVFNGRQMEIHFTKLPVDFAGGDTLFFKKENTVPMFANYLGDDSLAGQGTAPPGGAPQNHYFLKEAVDVTTSYGTVTIPAKTEVRVLSQSGSSYHVSGGGAEFDVQGEKVYSEAQ